MPNIIIICKSGLRARKTTQRKRDKINLTRKPLFLWCEDYNTTRSGSVVKRVKVGPVGKDLLMHVLKTDASRSFHIRSVNIKNSVFREFRVRTPVHGDQKLASSFEQTPLKYPQKRLSTPILRLFMRYGKWSIKYGLPIRRSALYQVFWSPKFIRLT